MDTLKDDLRYIQIAIEQAEIARAKGDVPIGAVIVYKDQIIDRAYNQQEQSKIRPPILK